MKTLSICCKDMPFSLKLTHCIKIICKRKWFVFTLFVWRSSRIAFSFRIYVSLHFTVVPFSSSTYRKKGHRQDQSSSFFHICFDVIHSDPSSCCMILRQKFRNENGHWFPDQHRRVMSDERVFCSVLSHFILIFTFFSVWRMFWTGVL